MSTLTAPAGLTRRPVLRRAHVLAPVSVPLPAPVRLVPLVLPLPPAEGVVPAPPRSAVPRAAPRAAPAAARPIRPTAGCVAEPARPAALRLTRRGRLVLMLLAMAALVAAGFGVLALTPLAQPFGGGGQGAVVERLTVRPGDTLWAIATRVAPDADPRDTVARIQDLNGLESSSVPAGVVLRVPAQQ